MVIEQLAEILAAAAVQKYVKACKCATQDDVANSLMKLVSIVGIGMCVTMGHANAVARLQAATDYIKTTQAGKKWKCEKAN
jgi:hypothetical protein